jgi:spermidine synthase
MVDIDQELVELCQQLLPEWHQGAFQDPRVELVFMGGEKYIERTDSPFDVILIDGCDALEGGSAMGLYSERFYRRTRKRLTPGGLLAIQAMEVSVLDYHDYKDHLAVRDTLLQIFPVVRSYTTFVPSFWTEWGFVIASDGPDPVALSRDVLAERLGERGPSDAKDLGATLDFYDPDAHVRMFTLSKAAMVPDGKLIDAPR